MSRLRSASVLVIAGALLAPASADADVECFHASSVLEVRLTQSNRLVQIERVGSTIAVRDAQGFVACGSSPNGVTPSVTNTNAVSASSDVGLQNNTIIVEDAAGMAPGGEDEPGSDDEIDIFVNLRDQPNNLLSVRVGQFGGNFTLGTAGVNTNTGEATPDIDVALNAVPRVDLRAGFGFAANFAAQGGSATGGAWTVPLYNLGSTVGDVLVGGEAGDELESFGGNDVLTGGDGDDVLDPGADDDQVNGNEGVDTVDYGNFAATTAVAVDLGIAGSQPTGGSGSDEIIGVENLIGTHLEDTLRGDGGPNQVEAGGSGDVVEGRGGPDVLRAGPGDDQVEARDGEADTIDCGDGDDDTAVVDAAPLDTVVGCETVVFPPPPAGPAPPVAPVAPAEETPGGPGLPAAPVLLFTGGLAPAPVARAAVRSLRLAPSAFAPFASGPSARAAGRPGPRLGTVVSFSMNRAAPIVYRVARRRSGRRVGRRCVARSRRNRARRSCTRFVTLRGSFSRPASAGTNRFRFAGRLRRRALAPGRYRLRATPRGGTSTRVAFRILG